MFPIDETDVIEEEPIEAVIEAPLINPCRVLEARLALLLQLLHDETDPFIRRALLHEIAHLRAEIAACRPISNLAIVGIERTQATQYFLFNGKGSGFAANNTVPLVADKDLILRVYINRTTYPQFPIPANVTGRVTYAGHPDLFPINGPIPGMSSSSIDRGNANHTLNFRVPAGHCTGVVTFTVTVFDPANPGNAASRSKPVTFSASFENVPRVRIHGVLIHYTGRGLDIAAPTGLDLVNTLVWVGKVYPISGFNYTGCTVVNFNGDLTVGGGGGCGTGWNQLFSMLWNMRAASSPDANGNRDVFVGLLPAGVPTSGVIGCGGGGVAIAYIGGGSVLAQEIGHAFGRAHAPCGNPGGPDPNYPTYNSYPSGSIGEFGVDTSNMQIFNPASTYDYMSYCGPVWTSPYTYLALKDRVVSGVGGAPAHPDRAGSRLVAGEYLFLNFRAYRSGKVELLNSFRVYTSAPPQEMGEPTKVGCDLLAADGELLYNHHCSFVNPHMDEDSSYADFQEAILLDDSWKDQVHSIAFTREGAVTHKHEVEAPAPEVDFTGIKQVKNRAELARLEWNVKPAARGKQTQHPVHSIVRYSNDDGATWQSVATDLTDAHHVVNLDLLPGGDKCMFQVITSSGIHSSIATSKPLEVPRKPRKAYILSPADSGGTFKQGEDLVLLGGGFSPDFETTDFDEVVWTSDRDGVIGTGYQVITQSLSAGRHRISIGFPDGLGGEASASVFVTIK